MRQPHSHTNDLSGKKEGKFRMLNSIFSCKKKKELHAALQKAPSHDRRPSEETSEVDDIITMFDCLSSDPSSSGKDPTERRDDGGPPVALRKRSCEPLKPNLQEDQGGGKEPTTNKGLPPIRTQSLPPITLGNSLLANVQFMVQRNSGGQVISHLAHRSQKSKSEHDLFDSRAKNQRPGPVPVGTGQTWKAAESSQVLTHKAWVSAPQDRLLDRPQQDTTTSPLDVLCSKQTPYMQKNEQGNCAEI